MEEMIKRAVSEGLKTQLENKPSKSPVGNKQVFANQLKINKYALTTKRLMNFL